MASDDIVVIKLYIDPWKSEKHILPFWDVDFGEQTTPTPAEPQAAPKQIEQPPPSEARSIIPSYARIRDPDLAILLRDFVNGKEWPLSTNVLCHWCCHRFDNTPIGLPIRYDAFAQKFEVINCFCSFACAAAFNLHVTRREENSSLLHFLARKLHGNKAPEIIKPAPSPLCLKAFGGTVDINEYRNKKPESQIIINPPPMISAPQQIQEIRDTTLPPRQEFVPLDTERVEQYKETLKLKRNKPLYKGNTLDNVLKIEIKPRET